MMYHETASDDREPSLGPTLGGTYAPNLSFATIQYLERYQLLPGYIRKKALPSPSRNLGKKKS